MRIVDWLLGKPIASRVEGKHRVGVFAGIPMLGLDALASAAYGPEAALTVLIPLGYLGLRHFGPILLVTIGLLVILYFSYRQTIHAYPHGGGSYTVASSNLGRMAGLFAAASLLVDYVLTAAVGISAGVGALVSAVPSLLPYLVPLCLAILAILTFVSLRGVRESGLAYALPTYLFVVSLGGIVAVGVARVLMSGGRPVPIDTPPALPAATEAVSWWLILRAFASGCTAMTGVEAVSNGVAAFTRPTVAYAQKTLTAIVAILGVLLAGIGYLCLAYKIGAVDPDSKGYQSVISQLVSAIAGRGFIYYVTIGSVLAVLALSANTGFADFPRLCRMLAQDEFLPRAFATRGRRLVFTLGILVLAFLTGALLIGFGGVTDRLIPLFAVGAFAAFTLSQAGMVVHWQKTRGRGYRTKLFVNGLGAVATGIALIVILCAKLTEGAWVTLLLIPLIVFTFHAVNRHYSMVRNATQCLCPFDVHQLNRPIVVLPIKRWDMVAEKALMFALSMSDEVIAVHVGESDDDIQQLNNDWQSFVVAPRTAAGRVVPELSAVSTPYRRFITPLLAFLDETKKKNPDRFLVVIIPEFVEAKWYDTILHNQRASTLKAALFFGGDKQTVVVNVPWYLGRG